MLSLFIMSIMALALTAVIGYSAFSTMKSTETFAMVQQNTARMEQIARLVEAELRDVGDVSVPLDNYPDVPVAIVNGTNTIPEWIVANRLTPWGGSYGYCAYAPKSLGSPTQSIVTVAGKSYLTNGDLAANDISGDTLPESMDIAAVIISPVVNKTTVPACNQVVFNSGTGFTVPDGTVAVIMRHSPISIGYRKSSATSSATCNTSDAGPVNCLASCGGSQKILFGECSYEGSAVPPQLLSFKALDDDTFQCRWSQSLTADAGQPLRTGVACADVR